MAQKGAFFEIFKPIIWAQLCAYGNCPCTKSLLNFFWIHSSSGFPGIMGLKISKNAPFWAILGQLTRLFGPFWVNFPGKPLELRIQKNSVDFWYMGNCHRHIVEPK